MTLTDDELAALKRAVAHSDNRSSVRVSGCQVSGGTTPLFGVTVHPKDDSRPGVVDGFTVWGVNRTPTKWTVTAIRDRWVDNEVERLFGGMLVEGHYVLALVVELTFEFPSDKVFGIIPPKLVAVPDFHYDLRRPAEVIQVLWDLSTNP